MAGQQEIVTVKPKRPKGTIKQDNPDDIDEAEYLQEAVRVLFKQQDAEAIKNTFVDDVLLMDLRSKGVISSEDLTTDHVSSRQFYQLLLDKEEPCIWNLVLEALEGTQNVHKHVVENIRAKSEQLKQDPSQIIALVERKQTSEVMQNTARLAELIQDVGSNVLRSYCIRTFSKCECTNGTQVVSIEKAFTELCCIHGDQTLPFTRAQREAVLTDNNIPFFDLSFLVNALIFVLNNDTFGLTLSHDEKTSILEKLLRFAKLRNTIWLQFSKGISVLQFRAQWDEIIQILSYFAVDDKAKDLLHSANDIRTKKFDTVSIHALRTEMLVSIENSPLDEKDLIEKTQLLCKFLGEHLLGKMALVIDEVKTLTDVLNIQKLIPPEVTKGIAFDLNQPQFQFQLEDFFKQQYDLCKALQVDIKQDVGTLSRGISEIKAILANRVEENCLQEIKDIFQKQEGSFKFLVLNQTELKPDKTRSLARVLGCCPWNIIIDLDHFSRTEDGMHDKIAELFAKHRDYKVITYDEIKHLSDSFQQSLAKGEKSIWILANGCSQKGCDKTEGKFGKVAKILPAFLDNVLGDIPNVKSVLAMFLRIGNSCVKPMEKVAAHLDDVCQSLDKSLDYDNSVLASIVVKSMSEMSFSSIEINNMSIVVSADEIITTLADLYATEELGNKFFYPGDQGMCFMTSEEMAQFRASMLLYHKDIGKLSLDGKSKTDIDRLIKAYRIKFLRGDNLTPEGLYLHDQYDHIYAVRTQMEESKKTIERELKRRMRQDVKYRFAFQHCTIQHDPSGGGSTVLQYVLYKLKDEYPCFLFKYIEDKAIKELISRFRDSKLPILIAFDNTDVSTNHVRSLQQYLNNEYVPSVVVHVKQCYADDAGTAESDPLCVHVPSTLDENSENKIKFQRLYDHIKRNIDTDKVFLFGLLAFMANYKRRRDLVKQCLENVTHEQRTLLKVVCGVRKFCQFNINAKLFLTLFKTDDHKDFKASLGKAGDLMIFDENQFTIRPAHQCVIDPVFEELKVITHRSDKEILKEIVDDLAYIISLESSNKRYCAQLCHALFLQRENPADEHYSSFVQTLEEECGKEYVEEQLQRFVKLMKKTREGDHLRALLARYLLYQMNRLDDSIQQMRESLDIKGPTIMESTPKPDLHLLTAYGYLFRTVTLKRFQKMQTKRKSHSDSFFEFNLQQALEDTKEAVFAFQQSQKPQTSHDGMTFAKYSPHPFVGEAIARKVFLNLIFKEQCGSKTEEFDRYIGSSKDEFIKDCEFKALEALDKIEYLESHDKLHEHSRDLKKRMIECKFKLLHLRSDKGSVRKLLRSIPSSVPCDVGGIVRSLKNGQETVTEKWADLSVADLRMIYNIIDRRRSEPKLLACNYRDIINAMIYLKKAHKNDKFNIDIAIEWARLWTKNYDYDINAHFMHGVLLLAKGTEHTDTDLIKEARSCFDKCHELREKSPSINSWRKFKYYIGNGDGLARAIPYDPNIDKGMLDEFSGRLFSKHRVGINPFEHILTAKLGRCDNNFPIDQQPNICFNIAIGTDNIVAINAAKVVHD